MQAMITKTPKGKYFYLDSRRVSEMRYLDAVQAAIDAGRYSCATTKISGDIVRHYASV